MSTTKLSVVVVNYKSEKYIKNLIKSLRHIQNIIEELIIINNSSEIKIEKISTKINYRIIDNNSNLGFSKAVNIGINNADTSYILLLNPDVEIHGDNNINKMFKLLVSSNNYGAIGGKIYSSTNNKIQFTATSKPTFLTGLFEFTNLKKLIPKNIYSSKFWIESNKTISKPIEAYSLCGAFILFRKKLGKNVIRFDEDYFMYLEDIQFGGDINKLNYKVLFYPNSYVVHFGGKSNKSIYNIVLKYWYKSRKLYFKKNLTKIESGLLSFIFFIEEILLWAYHRINKTSNE